MMRTGANVTNTTHNGLLITTATVLAAYSVALLVAPGATLGVFGLAENVEGVWTARLLGASMLGFAGLAFFARNIGSLEARRAIDGAFLVGSTAALVISMWAQYLRVTNGFGWINVALNGALAVSYFYFIAGEDRDVEEAIGRPA